MKTSLSVVKRIGQNKHFLIPFKTVILSLCSCFIVETRTNFPVQFSFNHKPLLNSVHNWKSVFNITVSKLRKSAYKSYFSLFFHAFRFFKCSSRFYLFLFLLGSLLILNNSKSYLSVYKQWNLWKILFCLNPMLVQFFWTSATT